MDLTKLSTKQREILHKLPPSARLAWYRKNAREDLEDFKYRPEDYVQKFFGWEPWSGGDATGQLEFFDAYTTSIRTQEERYRFQQGEIKEKDLKFYKPGMTVQSIISIDAGHNVGKTKGLSGLLNHFHDCFEKSIIYSYAPTGAQIKDLLWKEVKSDRLGAKGLTGRTLDMRLEKEPDWFAKGMATSNAHGTGTERAQGQHGAYLMFLIDEAEGVADFVFDAIDSMTSGGIAHIVLIARNPRTSACRAHTIRRKKNVIPLRISCLNHPNVISGKTIVPSSVQRQWVDDKIDDWCRTVPEHNPDLYTFEVPWREGIIFQPEDQRFLWRVMGVVGGQTADDTFCPLGRYELAIARKEPDVYLPTDFTHAQIGIDCARFGDDNGTGYLYYGGVVIRYAQWVQKTSDVYYRDTRRLLLKLHEQGVKHVSVRVDGGGGFGIGIIDSLNLDERLFADFQTFIVHEVHFNGVAATPTSYADKITEMYAVCAEKVKQIAIVNPPEELENDFTQRKYSIAVRGRVEVKVIEPKQKFKKRMSHSPDDGDGFCLALAPEWIIRAGADEKVETRQIDEKMRKEGELIGIPKARFNESG